MRDYKKALVAGALAMSMLVGQAGHTDITASAKSIERTADMDLYNETGEVLLFADKYNNAASKGEQMIPLTEKSSAMVDGYYVQDQENIIGYKLMILDSTNSVSKITVDGKKKYNLSKAKNYSTDIKWYGFGGGRGDKLKCKYRLFNTKKLSQGKHTLTVKDKHGHETSIKLWNDTKAPKVKIYKKKNKFIIKLSDKGIGLGGFHINGFKTKRWSKRVTSATIVLNKKTCKYFNDFKKYGIDGRDISVSDRAGNSLRDENGDVLKKNIKIYG